MAELYDTIGHGYRRFRQPDPRIALAIVQALGSATSVLNVGAGTGSYEPSDRHVVSVEPSMTMIRQRPSSAAPTVQASAAHVPFRDASFDAALAILTLHHWPDQHRGLQELRRVARQRVVILTWDPDSPGFWVVRDYFPEMVEIDRRIFLTIEALCAELGGGSVRQVPIPHDCSDGFLGAYWRRPAAYLDPEVRGAISTFAKLADPQPGLSRLRQDLASGEWHRRNRELATQAEIDLGYRLVVATLPTTGRNSA